MRALFFRILRKKMGGGIALSLLFFFTFSLSFEALAIYGSPTNCQVAAFAKAAGTLSDSQCRTYQKPPYNCSISCPCEKKSCDCGPDICKNQTCPAKVACYGGTEACSDSECPTCTSLGKCGEQPSCKDKVSCECGGERCSRDNCPAKSYTCYGGGKACDKAGCGSCPSYAPCGLQPDCEAKNLCTGGSQVCPGSSCPVIHTQEDPEEETEEEEPEDQVCGGATPCGNPPGCSSPTYLCWNSQKYCSSSECPRRQSPSPQTPSPSPPQNQPQPAQQLATPAECPG